MKSAKEPKKQTAKKGNYSPVPQPEMKEYLMKLITVRFIIEVHEMERQGRVESRAKLERDLYLFNTAISQMRNGRLRVDTVAIHRLKDLYNGDLYFILTGFRKPEISGPTKGYVKLNVHTPYEFPYRTDPDEEIAKIATMSNRDASLDELLGRNIRAESAEPDEEEQG